MPCWLKGRPNFEPGINIDGFFLSEIGLGEAARLVYEALSTQDVKVSAVNRPFKGRQKDKQFSSICQERPNYSVGISIDGITGFRDLSSQICKHRYNIAYPFWELEIYPPKYIEYLNKFDRVWAPSRFIYDNLKQYESIKVDLVKHPIKLPKTRSDFTLLADTLKIIYFFDYDSFPARKNPEAAVYAFLAAFGNTKKDVTLTIKSRGTLDSGRRAWLAQMANSDSRINIIDETLTKEEMTTLLNAHDVFLSLHRSEGLGLGCAEALSFGKIVVATDYGGTTDFIDDQTGFPVNWKRVPVKQDEYVMSSGATWAEPCIEHAAEQLRRIYDDPISAQRKAEAGLRRISENHGFDEIGSGMMRAIGSNSPCGLL